MNNSRLAFSLILVAGMSLIACDKKSESDLSVPSARVESGRSEDQFGEKFGKAFRADPNSEPANVQESDVPPVSLTAEPLAVD